MTDGFHWNRFHRLKTTLSNSKEEIVKNEGVNGKKTNKQRGVSVIFPTIQIKRNNQGSLYPEKREKDHINQLKGIFRRIPLRKCHIILLSFRDHSIY